MKFTSSLDSEEEMAGRGLLDGSLLALDVKQWLAGQEEGGAALLAPSRHYILQTSSFSL